VNVRASEGAAKARAEATAANFIVGRIVEQMIALESIGLNHNLFILVE
jgi:hypothetical protein